MGGGWGQGRQSWQEDNLWSLWRHHTPGPQRCHSNRATTGVAERDVRFAYPRDDVQVHPVRPMNLCQSCMSLHQSSNINAPNVTTEE